MTSLFVRQFCALFLKNWLILAKHPIVNVFRCVLSPIGLAIFLAYAQVFLSRPNIYGLGTSAPVTRLADAFDPALQLVWTDDTNTTGSIAPEEIIAKMTSDFSSTQLRSVRKIKSAEIGSVCQENFNGASPCYACLSFVQIPAAGSSETLNYTIWKQSNLYYVNVKDHTSDVEQRILPLQWAVESAIIELETGVAPSRPTTLPYTLFTDDEQTEGIRLSFVSFAAGLLSLPFFAALIGTAYQLPGMAVYERANGLTAHMKAMGLLDSARILSWHLSLSLAYLPGWLVIGGIWQAKLYTGTNAGIVIAITLLTGLSVTSYSFFVMAPFGKSPQLAAIVCTIAALACDVVGFSISETVGTSTAVILTLFFPPMFFPFAIRCITGFEIDLVPTSATVSDPEYNLMLWPLMIVCIVGIFLWPYVGVAWERSLYDARNPSTGGWFGHKKSEVPAAPPDVAISIRNLGKDFQTSMFKRKSGLVTAISDLTLDIPKHGIFVLLGPNGAGKSTVMSILAGLTGRTRGTVVFEGGVEQPPRGSIGLVPQKNVLHPELTCYQTLRMWKSIKPPISDDAVEGEDIVQLLHDCELGGKVHYDAGALSGGQKRKLQLAIGLIGGSKIVLVDEATSGVDPLSRRSIWKTLNAVKTDRTIVFTTHFLDEADLLADDIAVLAAPGKLVAHGNPVKLKSTLGEGYTMKVTLQHSSDKTPLAETTALLDTIRAIAPETHVSPISHNELAYHLKTHDASVVKKVLETVEEEKNRLQIASYSVSATSIEDIFLDLMQDEEENKKAASDAEKEEGSVLVPELPPSSASPAKYELTSGTQRSVLGQALTIFHKRMLVARRSWLSYVIAMAVVLIASCVPLSFVPPDQTTCEVVSQVFPPQLAFFYDVFQSNYFIDEPGWSVFVAPPGILHDALGLNTTSMPIQDIPDAAALVSEIEQNYKHDWYGGMAYGPETGDGMFAWSAEDTTRGSTYLNAISNLQYNKVLNDTGRAGTTPRVIAPKLGTFPSASSGSLKPLQWAAFYALAMGVLPAFFTLYVAQERRSSVQAMQFSNGLSNPAGLWLGHLMFDSIFATLIATILVIVFTAKSTYFQGLGYLWFIMVLYGYTGTMFAYLFTVFITSPLAAFAVLAGYQIVLVGLYISGYLLSFTYGKSSQVASDMTAIHFTMSLLSPALNVARASFISVNAFSLLCDGKDFVPTSSLGNIMHFGGPILYLIVFALILFGALVWADSGSVLKQRLLRRRALALRSGRTDGDLLEKRPDVLAEAEGAKERTGDALRVLDVSKAFGRAGRVVDSVSFSVPKDTIFALLGPNGAGKTTTFNMIRGDLTPDSGEILINGQSIVRDTQAARLSLGVCPQFTAIDSQLTVRQHLNVYARLKGIPKGEEMHRNVAQVMELTGLHLYADRLANKLSGGNQRKLALAIALIGNPSVILIDEFSTGVDAKMKRDMWGTLKNVAVGKAIVITTHSMEEASTLANKVGIIAKRMLAVDTNDALIARYARYLVHFPCRTRDEIARAQALMARVPGARMVDDVATRFEVPIGSGNGRTSLAELFAILAEGAAEAGVGEYTVEEASLESVFMMVIRENEIEEGDGEARYRRGWWKV